MKRECSVLSVGRLGYGSFLFAQGALASSGLPIASLALGVAAALAQAWSRGERGRGRLEIEPGA